MLDTYKLPEGKALILRTCNRKMQGYGGFQWPKSGPVSAPDWSPEPECGHGLHGLLWGEGHGSYLDWGEKAIWIVAEVDTASIVSIDDKVKFPSANVLFCGTRDDATAWLLQYASGKAIVGSTLTGGYRSTVTGGYRSTVTGGDCSTLIFHYWSASQRRVTVGIIGENGLLPNIAYRVENGEIVPANPS